MKILQINKYLLPRGGSEAYMFQLAQALESKGHIVKFWGMEDPNNIVNDFQNLNVDFIDYKNLSTKEKVISSLNTIYSFKNINKISKVLDVFKPDIVHIHNYNFQITPSILSEIKKRGIAIVQTVHDSQMVCPNHRLFNPTKNTVCVKCTSNSFWNCTKDRCFDGSFLKSSIGTIESLLYHQLDFYNKYIDVFVSPSNFLAQLLSKRIKSRIEIIPNYADINYVLKKDKSVDYYLYYGRISEDKGINEMIEIFNKTDLLLKIIGDGAYKETLINKIKAYPNIEYIGPKYGAELFQIVKNAKYVVQLAKSYENCPMTVVESFALQVPVIASNHSGFKDLIVHGETGFLFKNIFDVDDCVLKIKEIDRFNNQNLKENILEFYTTKLNKEIHINKILNIYNELLTKN